MPAADDDELEAAVEAVRRFVYGCALDIVQGRVTSDEGAAALERVRNNLVELASVLEGFLGLEAEHDMAGYDKSGRPDVQAEIEREILSRAETLRRTLES